MVADAQTEDEPVRMRLLDRVPRGLHCERVARPHRRDAGADHEPLRPGEEPGRGDERIAAHHFGDPQRAVAERLQFRRDLARACRRLPVEAERPDANRSEIHTRTLPSG